MLCVDYKSVLESIENEAAGCPDGGPLLFEPRNLFDQALVGSALQCGGRVVACYSFERLVQAFMDADGVSREVASDAVHYNMLGTFAGEAAPVVLFQ